MFPVRASCSEKEKIAYKFLFLDFALFKKRKQDKFTLKMGDAFKP